jgi:hypothetical protein
VWQISYGSLLSIYSDFTFSWNPLLVAVPAIAFTTIAEISRPDVQDLELPVSASITDIQPFLYPLHSFLMGLEKFLVCGLKS